jgi:hypothetical protein
MVDKEAWLDPTEDEVQVGQGTLTLACMPALSTITNVSQNGHMSPDVCIKVREHTILPLRLLMVRSIAVYGGVSIKMLGYPFRGSTSLVRSTP